MKQAIPIRFFKMQGLGNDFLLLGDAAPADAASLSKRLCDRHFGVGADGVIFVSASRCADLRMQIFNADGSEAAMCGNGIRCVGKYAYETRLTGKTDLTVETNSGIKRLRLHLADGAVASAAVEMGTVRVFDALPLGLDGAPSCIPVDVGNPHAVVFCEAVTDAALFRLGPLMQRRPEWPDGVNLELVQPLGDNRLRMRVWERGSGITLACGTGACASAAAAVRAGLCQSGQPIEVALDGGSLRITVREDGSVCMEGPAVKVFEGVIDAC